MVENTVIPVDTTLEKTGVMYFLFQKMIKINAVSTMSLENDSIGFSFKKSPKQPQSVTFPVMDV